MNNQQVLDISAPFIYQQGQRSIGPLKICVYRSPEGLKCAIGACIPDKEYISEFEHGDSSVAAMIRNHNYFAKKFSDCTLGFLTELQELHDNIDEVDDFRNTWRNGVIKLAEEHSLKVPEMSL